jgi:hypothetical protein
LVNTFIGLSDAGSLMRAEIKDKSFVSKLH